MRALGLLIRLLSRPDNWKTTSETLAREFDCGREQVRSVLRELADAGYMALKKEQNAHGQWSSSWFVFDIPETQIHPEPEEPKPAKPEPGKPYAGELGAITRTDLTSTDNKACEVGFASFWQAYPKKTAKPAALLKFKSAKLKSGELDAILTDIEIRKQADDWTKENGKYVPNPATYLSQRRWEDGETAHTAKKIGGVLAGAI